MRIHALINYDIARPGLLIKWANLRGHTLTSTDVYKNEKFPALSEIDILVVLGGPMGAYEEDAYPWLKIEKEYIKLAISINKFVLGICLGAQLIADVLGGKVYENSYKEIGWWSVKFTADYLSYELLHNLPKEIKVFQYHGDTFYLPPKTRRVASNNAFMNQAFLFKDNVMGLQFHPEFDEEILEQVIATYGHEIKEDVFIQEPNEFLRKVECIKDSEKFLFQLMDNVVSQINNNKS